jgi:Na+/H+-dicarboxylate symporter
MFSGDYADKGALPDAVATLLGMIPTNVFSALNEANIPDPGVLHVPRHRPGQATPGERQAAGGRAQHLVDAFVWMINKVMLIAPIGVFGLMADAIGTYGF